jgi:ABC-type phosphate/phosphonate transport system permease subunit
MTKESARRATHKVHGKRRAHDKANETARQNRAHAVCFAVTQANVLNFQFFRSALNFPWKFDSSALGLADIFSIFAVWDAANHTAYLPFVVRQTSDTQQMFFSSILHLSLHSFAYVLHRKAMYCNI